jgi:hypothetical protein
MILDELEQDFRERKTSAGTPMVILAVQIEEQDVRSLRCFLTARRLSLSEYVRTLIHEKQRHPGGKT